MKTITYDPTFTFKYLYPALIYGYNYDFRQAFDFLKKKGLILNVYIDDVDSDEFYTNAIFILLKDTKDLRNILGYFRGHKEAYLNDYQVKDFDNPMHILVLHVPSDRAYNNFLLSKYSQMYEPEEADVFFKIGPDKFTPAYHVVTRTQKRLNEVVKQFNLDDSAKLDEYERKLNIKKEIFNYRKLLVSETD